MTITNDEILADLVKKHIRYQRMFVVGGVWTSSQIAYLIYFARKKNGKPAVKYIMKRQAVIARMPLKRLQWVWPHNQISNLLQMAS